MKIAILTYYFANNYGAVLQATALQTVLHRVFNKDVEFIPYYNELQKKNNALIQHGGLKALCYNIIRMPFLIDRKKRIERFRQYRRKYLNVSKQNFDDCNILAEIEKYELIVVGSDQVWNPNCPDFSKIYFEIIDAKVPICTYGVSLGDCSITQLEMYKNYIQKLPYILVREESARELLEKVGYKSPVNMVLDPTMLLTKEEWEGVLELPENVRKEKYILCYFLRRNHVFEYWKTAKKIAAKLGYKLICVNVNAGLFSYTHKTIMDAGPIEFLKLIRGASLVLTNSFHGTAFSILFHIPFYSLYLLKGNDNRIVDMLRLLRLEDRRLCVYEQLNNVSLDIDYSKTDKRLKLERHRINQYFDEWRKIYDL